MIGEEIFDGIEKPENWPANAKECELENIYISLKKFIKDPSYKNKEVLDNIIYNADSVGAYNIMRKYKIRNKINIPMINKGLSNPKKYVSV